MPAAVASPEVKVASPSQTEAAPKPQAGISREVRQFGQMAAEGLKTGRKTESLAAIAGWGLMGKVNARLENMAKGVYELVDKGKLTQEQALPYFEKIAYLSKNVDEKIEPGLGN